MNKSQIAVFPCTSFHFLQPIEYEATKEENFALACVPECEWRSRYRGRSLVVDFIWCRESRRLVEVRSSGTARLAPRLVNDVG